MTVLPRDLRSNYIEEQAKAKTSFGRYSVETQNQESNVSIPSDVSFGFRSNNLKAAGASFALTFDQCELARRTFLSCYKPVQPLWIEVN